MSSASARNVTPITIAFAHQGRDWIRGSEQCLLDLIERLDAQRFRSVVLCDAPSVAREAERRGAWVERIAQWEGGPISPRPLRQRVSTVLRAHDVRLVHANMTGVLPAIIPAARAQRIPVVAHLHLTHAPQDRLHLLLHQATAIVGVAEHVVAPIRGECSDEGAVRVIPNGIDGERLARGDASMLRAELRIPPESLVATSVGSLIRRKGHDVTIRALRSARDRGLDAHLLICGDGEEEASLRALALELGVAAHTHFLGLRSDVGAVLRDATDVYISAARDEALPLNVLEAQWAGVPVICSDIPAHRESMIPGETGELVRPEHPDAFADVLVAFGTAPDRRAEYGRRGRELVSERFSLRHYVDSFTSLYDELLTRPRAAYGWVRGTRWPSVYNAWILGVLQRRVQQFAGGLSRTRQSGT